jgi:hypothetical protein
VTDLKLFLSAVSDEFRSYRVKIRNKLDRGPNVTVKTQEDFGPLGLGTLAKLASYIVNCTAVAHLVGDMTGSAPPKRAIEQLLTRPNYKQFSERLGIPPEDLLSQTSPISYTQWEAYLAIYHQKDLLIAEPAINAQRESRTYQRDDQQIRRQQAHRDRLKRLDRYPEIQFVDADDLSFELVLAQLNSHLTRNFAPPPSEAYTIPAGVRRFDDYYLTGHTTAGKKIPTPFGGRQRELQHLNRWLADPSADPRLLVSAPAGRGKSALLAKWVDNLRKSVGTVPPWNLIFVPISNRFQTNAPEAYLAHLAHSLATIANHILLLPASDPEPYYRNAISSLLDKLININKPVLIVIDGLDEALGTEFLANTLPADLPATLRVVASARWLAGDIDATGWLRRLGWYATRRIDGYDLIVEPLDTAAIGDVLLTMGAPVDVIGRDKALVARLAVLTQGEPLLLRFYAEDLWTKASSQTPITRDTLDSLQPGFAAYFKEWVGFQGGITPASGVGLDPRTVEATMAVIGFAKGPLEAKDLLDICRTAFPNLPWRLIAKPHIESLRRFIIGDGSLRAPYALSHPKLGEYLRETECAQLSDLVLAGFATWGRLHIQELNQGARPPERASNYALQFLRYHFDEARIPIRDYLPLVEDGWRRAWAHFDGGERGFSGDVQAVSDVISNSPDTFTYLGAKLRCALTLSSIRSLGFNIPGALILAAFNHRVLSIKQASHLAELIGDDEDSVRTIAHLAYLNVSNLEQFWELFATALSRALLSTDELIKARILKLIVDTALSPTDMPDFELLPDVRERAITAIEDAAHSVKHPRGRTELLTALVRNCSRTQYPRLMMHALDAATAISSPNERVFCYLDLLPIAVSAYAIDLTSLIRSTIASIQAPWIRGYALKRLALLQPTTERYATIDAALKEMASTKIEWVRAEAFGDLAPILSPHQLQTVSSFARELTEAGARARALVGIAPYLPAEQQKDVLAQIDQSTKQIERPNTTIYILAKSLPLRSLENIGSLVATTIRGSASSDEAIATCIRTFASDLSTSQAEEIIPHAKSIANVTWRVYALSALLPRLTEERRRTIIADSLSSINALPTRDDRVQSLKYLAPHLTPDPPKVVQPEELSGLKEMGSRKLRSAAIRALAPRLAASQMAAALSAAKSVGDVLQCIKALVSISVQLTSNERFEILGDALAFARRAENESDRASAIIYLSAHLAPRQVSEILAIIAEMTAEEHRAAALVGVRRALSSEHSSTALQLGFRIKNEVRRYEVLAKIATHLSKDDGEKALSTVRQLERKIGKKKSPEVPFWNDDGLAESHSERHTFSLDQRFISRAKAFFAATYGLKVDHQDERQMGPMEEGTEEDGYETRTSRITNIDVSEKLDRLKLTPDGNQRGIQIVNLIHSVNSGHQKVLFEMLLTTLSKVSRPQFFELISETMNISVRFGGQEVLMDLRRSICDVVNWYP